MQCNNILKTNKNLEYYLEKINDYIAHLESNLLTDSELEYVNKKITKYKKEIESIKITESHKIESIIKQSELNNKSNVLNQYNTYLTNKQIYLYLLNKHSINLDNKNNDEILLIIVNNANIPIPFKYISYIFSLMKYNKNEVIESVVDYNNINFDELNKFINYFNDELDKQKNIEDLLKKQDYELLEQSLENNDELFGEINKLSYINSLFSLFII